MKNTLHISIFGLSLSVINVLKSAMTDILGEKYNLIWTNLTDQKLQLLLVNADFIDLPHIQKIKDNKLPILQIEKSSVYASQIKGDILYLPFEKMDALSNWINKNFLPKLNSFNPIYADNNHSDPVNKKISYQTLKSVLDQLFIPSGHSKFIIKNNNRCVALIDLEQHCFYPVLDWFPTNEEIRLEPADLNSIVQCRNQIRPEDLNQGLWKFIWTHMQYVEIEFTDYYRLTKWPQIKEFDQRKDLFKLAAIFSEGATASYAHQQLKLGERYIHQFLCTSMLANMLESIAQDQAKYTTQTSQPIKKDGNKMMIFFNKLRKKLGI